MSLDVLPAEVPAEYAPAMVAACSDALADGRCALAQTLPESTQPEAVALVLWQGDGFLQVTVRVGRGGGQWVARALTFSERDSISERWTTVGLTVATLVGETRVLDGKRPDRPQQKTPVQPAPLLVHSTHAGAVPASADGLTTPAAPRWLGRFGALTGPGWDAGDWRLGGWLSLGFRLPKTPVVLGASGSYALSRGPSLQGSVLTTRWATAGLGVGLTGSWSELNVAGSVAIEVAYRRVDADFRGHSTSDYDLPVSLRALASFPARGPLAVTGGVSMRLPPNNPNETSDLRVRGAAISAEALVGLEVRL